MTKKLYITTAIDYVNASPHLGHALEKIQADVVARYHRSLKEDVFFLTGSDENSLKNVQSAEKEGISTEDLVAKNADVFKNLKKSLSLSYDEFIRTTEERHIKGSKKLWLACKDDIYKKKYTGLYCVGCEEFYKESELQNGLCVEHKTKPELIEEENYFFKLSKYQNKIKELIEGDKLKIIPKKRKNEILSFINSGIEDICISRSSERSRGWGIDVPDDSSQKIWVWFDALSNYINALGYADDEDNFKIWWQENENKLHVIGKGISRFHAVYWIGMLMSAGLSLPSEIFIHGYLTVANQKMSKSLGNVVDPVELVKKYGTDAVRYYLLREITPTEDGDFTYEKFEQRYNSDLAGGIGNLLARTVTLAKKPVFNNLKPTEKIKSETEKYKKEYNDFLGEFKFNDALKSIWELISHCDKYINEEKPWEEKGNSSQVISDVLFSLGEISEILKIFLPETSEKIKLSLEKTESIILFLRLTK
ncbi:MAG: methionine--tRNA ligase [Candidatus Staskawiczbacteria bacterium]|nr:methionine--tRNA ligase [Candidatus Staskawiczbacteria bacterium]